MKTYDKDPDHVPDHTEHVPGAQKKDVLGWAATGFALVVTFSAEYELAKAVGIHQVVALAVPGALDVYVLRALQVKRDVFLAVLAMVAVNAASHLVTAGVLLVDWRLIVAVSAIAPVVLWRVHVLGGFRGTAEWSVWRTAKLHDVPEHVVREAEAREHTSTEHAVEERASVPVLNEHDDTPRTLEHWLSVPDRRTDIFGWDTAPEHTEHTLRAVPDVVTVHVPVPEDDELLDRARVVSTSGVPTVRALKTVLKVGTPRAQRLRAQLIQEQEESTS